MELPTPSLDTWTSLFLLAAGQGLFLSVLLFQRNRKHAAGDAWLAAVILSFSLLLVFNVSFWTRYHWHFPPINLLYPSLAFVVGPFLLFYLDSLAEEPFFDRFRWVHFLPAILVFVLRIPAYWQPLSTLQQAAVEGHQGIQAPLHLWGMGWLVSPVFIMSYLLIYAGLVYWYVEQILGRWNTHTKTSRPGWALALS